MNLLLQAMGKETSLPLSHFGLHARLKMNHACCDKCYDLITVDRLGVAAAPYNVASITWFQWVVTDEGMHVVTSAAILSLWIG